MLATMLSTTDAHAYFKGFEVVDGNLNWYDYEMIFPLKDLYQGEI